MNIIREQDLENLSPEDLKLLLTYNEEKEILKEITRNPENQKLTQKEYLQRVAELVTFDTIRMFNAERNGLNVYYEIIDNLTLLEVCSRIWEDQHQTLKEKFEFLFLSFKSDYQSLRNADLDHNRIINNFIIKYKNQATKIDSEIIRQIGSLRLKEIKANVEKYDLMLQNDDIHLDPIYNSYEFSLSKIELKFPESPEGYINLLESKYLALFEEKFLNFLKSHSYKILQNYEELSFLSKIENFEDVHDNIYYKDYTPNRQAIATYFLLKAAGVSNIDLTIMAKFIQFVTRRNLGAKKITDTEIYKNIKALKFKENDKSFLLNEFEKLNIKEDFLKFISKNM